MDSVVLSLPVAVAGLLVCALVFLPARRSLAACFLRALGMIAVVTLPVGLAQFLWVVEGADRADFPALLMWPLVAIPFNAGGLLAAASFESVHRAGLLEQRQFWVFDNLGAYFPLVLGLVSIGAGVIAARIRDTGRVLADPVILGVLGAALLNSILGISWPWWTT